MKKQTRRMKRMERRRKKVGGLMLTSLMDIFTILVFFLLVNSSSNEVMQTPKEVKLPDSIVEAKPRETVVVMVTPEMVLVQGENVIKTSDLLVKSQSDIVPPITDRLEHLEANIIGISTKTAVESKEITIQADKSIPFVALKKIMSTCTHSGYGKISLAVNQKGA